MSALILIGWLCILAIAIWTSVLSAIAIWMEKVGFGGRALFMFASPCAVITWVMCIKLAPFSFVWSAKP